MARAELSPGDAVTLDYGSRPLRDVLRNYCFVPLDAAERHPHEVRRPSRRGRCNSLLA